MKCYDALCHEVFKEPWRRSMGLYNIEGKFHSTLKQSMDLTISSFEIIQKLQMCSYMQI